MKPRQILIIAALAAASGAIILALAAVVAGAPTPPTRHTPAITPRPSLNESALPSQEACQWEAAQKLTRAGLGGTVTLSPDGVLRFNIIYLPTQGQAAGDDGQIDQAAQLVWTAFDIALALEEEACGVFTQVEVVILVQITPSARISASVSAADLSAFNAGEMSEDAFIRRVTYQVERP